MAVFEYVYVRMLGYGWYCVLAKMYVWENKCECVWAGKGMLMLDWDIVISGTNKCLMNSQN